MGWIAIGAWIFAALVLVVVLGYCGYELAWKAKRLQANLAEVQGDAQLLAGLQAQVAQTQTKIAAVTARSGRD